MSPTYAGEILDGGAGGWLRGTLGKSEIRSKFHGILNGNPPPLSSSNFSLGIDVDDWNPSTDIHLPSNFSRLSPNGKEVCKEYLQKARFFCTLFW